MENSKVLNENFFGAEFDTSEDVPVVSTFDSMGLKEELLQGIHTYGFEKPSALQQRSILPIMADRDVIAQAPAGSGKTAAVAIALLQSLDVSLLEPQVLVVCATREQAAEAQRLTLALGGGLGVRCHACGGGYDEDLSRLEFGQHVVFGTPDTLLNMLDSGALVTGNVASVVLDAADEMLVRGLQWHVLGLWQSVPPAAQVVLLTTTQPRALDGLTAELMDDPIRILIKSDEPSLEGIEQFFVNVQHEARKFDTLCKIHHTLAFHQAVVYCHTKSKVIWLTKKMLEANYSVSCMHEDTPRKERLSIVKEFLSGQRRVLIATDVWAQEAVPRQPSLVVNYDLPAGPEQYLRRSGRAGRFHKGVVANLVTAAERGTLAHIERYFSAKIIEVSDT